MTAGQKRNIERLKKLQVEAKKLRAKNPRLSHSEAIKLASGKKLGAYKVIEKNEKESTQPSKTLKIKRDKKGHFKGYKRVAGSKVSERKILTASHKVKAAANKLDELQHEHMLQKAISGMMHNYIAVYTQPHGISMQKFKSTSLPEAKKLAAHYKKMHNLKGTLKVSKYSHL